MRAIHLTFRWQTATVVAVSCFLGGISVALGTHEQRVDSAVSHAREQARLLGAERQELKATLEKAQEVSQVSASVADTDEVASAAAGLSQAATAAALAVDPDAIEASPGTIAPPTWASAPLALPSSPGPYASTPELGTDASAVLDAVEQRLAAQSEAVASTPDASSLVEARPTESATPSDEPSWSVTEEPTDATTAADEATESPEAAALAALVADPEIARVLRGEEDDLEVVTAAAARLEETAAEVEAATRRVEGTTAVLEAATAEAALARANISLEERRVAVDGLAEAASAMIDAVDGHVTESKVVDDVERARATLLELSVTPVDREDSDAVTSMLARVSDATSSLDRAEAALASSHQSWVSAENDRRAAVNKKRLATYERQLDKAYAASRAAYEAAALARQAGWSGAPAGVTYGNGAIPASELCRLSFAPGEQLQCDAAQALERADADYFAETGQHLALLSSYRSYGAQVATQASQGYLAATPGTSNHGWGLAADFEPASAAWMSANGSRYGWVHPLWARPGGSKPESWHHEFVAPGVSAHLPSEPSLLKRVTNALRG